MTNAAAFSPFAETIVRERYAHDSDQRGTAAETWRNIADRVGYHVFQAVSHLEPRWRTLASEVSRLIFERKFIPAGRYLAAAGRPMHQTQNCLLNRVEDSREGWGEHTQKAMVGLMTGAGLGVNYSRLRAKGTQLKRSGGYASGPVSLIQATNELGRCAMSGGSRRAALWAGLAWWHDDIFDFVRSKDWSPEVRKRKEADFNYHAPLDQTNISVCLDDEFFAAIRDSSHSKHSHANAVYRETVERMIRDAEPGFSIDIGDNAGEDLRNACTEITSRDDSDICNLGSINMARIESLEEMRHAVEIGTAFLLAGSVYSHVPYEKVGLVRERNRRLGLGLMGLHEFMLKQGSSYGPNPALEPYLVAYTRSTPISHRKADEWSISRPIKTRGIAPNGTIGIVAETTTGLEPIFAVAMKRRYFHHGSWHYQYIVDPTAKRLVDDYGINPDEIQTAYSLAEKTGIRLEFQGWIQRYVDHAISSTINLPAWGSRLNNPDTVDRFASELLHHLPNIRGITCYPDGCRGGQPLVPVDYYEAVGKVGQVFVEQDSPTIDPAKLSSYQRLVSDDAQDSGEFELITPNSLGPDGRNEIEFHRSDDPGLMPDVCSLRGGGTCGA